MDKKQNSLKICILQSQYLFKYYLDQFLRDMGYSNVSKFIIKRGSFDEIIELENIVNQGFDLYFNLCDGLPSQCVRAGVEVLRYLLYRNVPIVSPNINCLYPPRLQIKEVCFENNIKTPAFQFVYDFQKDLQKLTVLRFPLIVKHHNGANSIGLTIKSKVTNEQDLARQLKIMLNRYGGSLVQQFIEGRQFTCLLVESGEQGGQPYAYDPVEYIFKDPRVDFKYEEIKMVQFNQMQVLDVDDQELREEIKMVCKKLFKGMNFMSYARVDLRMNAKKELFVLQINSIPSMFFCKEQAGSADQIVYRSKGGHYGFIQNQIKSALLRYTKNKNIENENVIEIRQICLNEIKKQQKVMDLKLSNPEKSNILCNLFYQSYQKNNRYVTRLSKQALRMLKDQENSEIGYIFNEDQLKQLE